MKFNQLSALALILFLGLETKAQALTLYNNKAAFLSATGATSATAVGDITFSIAPPSSALFIGGLDWTPLMSGNEIAISGSENLDVDLVRPVYALGFDFVEPIETNCYADCYDSTFGVTLKYNDLEIDTFTFNAPNDVLAFIGFSSNLKFNRVEIRELTNTIDDEFFGEFYTAAVPEPLTLLGVGTAIGFGAAFKRKLRQK